MATHLRTRMSDLPQTRHSLLLELSRKSDEAWAEFLEVYERAIFRAALGRGLQEADARDVTQEVLAAVHRRLPSWNHETERGSFRAWLLRVARNVSIDALVERARGAATGASEAERALDALAQPSAEEGTLFDLEVQRSLFEWAAREVREEVQPKTWRAFELTALEGVAAEEAAAQLSMPVGSVYTAKCRVVARIRARVARLRDVDPEDSERS